LSHIGFSHRRGVLRSLFRTLHGPLGYQRPSACFDLSVCLSVFSLSVHHFSVDLTGWLIRLPALLFVASNCSILPFASSDWPLPSPNLCLSFPYLITIEIVSASSSHAPRASQNPALELPRFTHVAGKNRATIPIAKASKQELVAGLGQYSQRHGEYPDNYPGGPQDLSDSGDESSGDELDVRQDPETLAHATNRPPLQLIPRLKYSTPNSPPRDANIIILAVQTIRTAARQPQHI
jgi:hypothetical protein